MVSGYIDYDSFTLQTAPQLAFTNRLRNGAGPAIMQVLGDSTGNDATDWARVFLADYANEFPAWTVQHRLWSDAIQGYLPSSYNQIGTAGEAYLVPGGSPGCTIPDSDSATVYETDFMLRCKIRCTDYATGNVQVIASQFGPSGSRGWRLYFNGNGAFTFGYSSDGTSLVEAALLAEADVIDLAAGGTDLYIGVKFSRTNATVQAITSTDGATWIDTGLPVSGTTIANLFNTPTSPQVGNAGNSNNPFGGRIYWVEVYKGTEATDLLAWRFDASLYTTGSTFVDAEGRTWTLANAAAITTGAPLLLMMNGSHPGATMAYAEDVTRQPKLISAPANLTIFNWGHNQSEANVQAAYKALVDDVLTAWPSSGVVVNRQNPQRAVATNYARQQRHQAYIGELAAKHGYGIIDCMRRFLEVPTRDTTLMGDDVHPNVAGYRLWADEALRTFGVAPN